MRGDGTGAPRYRLIAAWFFGSLAVLAVSAIFMNALSLMNPNAYARESWPEDLVAADAEAQVIMGTVAGLMGGSASGWLDYTGLGLPCGGGAGHTIGGGGRLLIDTPMPEQDDPLPEPLDNLWNEWNASGFNPTAPISQYDTETRRIVFTAQTRSGTSLTAKLAPRDRPPPPPTMPDQQSRPWTPTELTIDVEYETACFAFDEIDTIGQHTRHI